MGKRWGRGFILEKTMYCTDMFRMPLLNLMLLLLLPCMSMAAEPLHVVTLDAPPMVVATESGITGLAAELANEGLKRAGYLPDIELMPWKRAVFMAKEGRVDALFYAVFNKERDYYFYYPNVPLFQIEIVALKRMHNKLEIDPDADNLDRWRIGIGRGYSYGPKVEKFIDKAGFRRVELTASNDINVTKLLENRVDIVLVDRALGRYFIEKYSKKLEFVTNSSGELVILDSRSAYLVFSKKTRTQRDAERFSEALRSMMADGTYDEILSRYQ